MLNSVIGAALVGFFAASCTASATIPCASSSQCPAGDVCSSEGVCEAKTETLADGFIEVIAGGGNGDDGPGEEAIFRGIEAIAVDADGTLYLGENSRGLIRKISPDGIITTIAGNGVRGGTYNTPISGLDTSVSPGDFALHEGFLYFTDTEGDRVVRMELATSMIELVATGFDNPRGIAVDVDGNVYVGDYNTHRVRRISASTGSVSTFAGTGISSPSDGNGTPATSANISGPWGVAVDSEYLYISSYLGDRVRRVNLATGIINSYAGTGSESFSGDDGPATSAAIYAPRHLRFDSAGNLLVADYSNNRIRKIDKVERTISTIAGGTDCCFIAEDTPADQTYLPSPGGLAVGPDDTIYVGDLRNHLLRRIAPDGNIKTIAGGVNPEGDVGTEARINSPNGVAPDRKGNLIIADREGSRVLRLNRTTGKITVVAGTGRKGFSGDGSSGDQADLSGPSDVVVDDSGNIYIADSSNARVRKVDPAGVISTFAGGGNSDADGGPANMAILGGVNGLALDEEGNVYFTESNKVRMVNASGIITTFAGTGVSGETSGDGGPATEAGINNPIGIEFDTANRLYIAEANGNVIRRVDADGTIYTFAGSGKAGNCGDGLDALLGCFQSPRGLASGKDGAIYVTDTYNHRIRRIDRATKVMSSVTTGGCCTSSPRVEAHTAKLYSPVGLTAMPDGSLIFSQTGDGLIRRLSR